MTSRLFCLAPDLPSLFPPFSPLVHGGRVVTAQRLILGLMGGSVGSGWSAVVSAVLTAQGSLRTTGWHAAHWLARPVPIPGSPCAFLRGGAGKFRAWFPSTRGEVKTQDPQIPEAP